MWSLILTWIVLFCKRRWGNLALITVITQICELLNTTSFSCKVKASWHISAWAFTALALKYVFEMGLKNAIKPVMFVFTLAKWRADEPNAKAELMLEMWAHGTQLKRKENATESFINYIQWCKSLKTILWTWKLQENKFWSVISLVCFLLSNLSF